MRTEWVYGRARERTWRERERPGGVVRVRQPCRDGGDAEGGRTGSGGWPEREWCARGGRRQGDGVCRVGSGACNTPEAAERSLRISSRVSSQRFHALKTPFPRISSKARFRRRRDSATWRSAEGEEKGVEWGAGGSDGARLPGDGGSETRLVCEDFPAIPHFALRTVH